MLNGQWFGTIEGTNTGFAILNLEYVDDHYEGQLFINDDNPLLPSTIAKVVLPYK
jgi:bacillopeptidase F (M6 metalloprotease family)